MTALERRYVVEDGALVYQVDMEMEGTPLVLHTTSHLIRET